MGILEKIDGILNIGEEKKEKKEYEVKYNTDPDSKKEKYQTGTVVAYDEEEALKLAHKKFGQAKTIWKVTLKK
jgi:hypothetical protein